MEEVNKPRGFNELHPDTLVQCTRCKEIFAAKDFSHNAGFIECPHCKTLYKSNSKLKPFFGLQDQE